MAKTVVFVVLSARTERTKDTFKGDPLKIPLKSRKSSQQPHRFFAKARRCELCADASSEKLRLRNFLGFEVASFC